MYVEPSENWSAVIKTSRLKRESRYLWSRPEGEDILLCWVNDRAYAVSAACPHNRSSLERGRVDPERLTLECPHHQWEFSITSGQGTRQGGCLKTYPTRIAEKQVWVNCAGL